VERSKTDQRYHVSFLERARNSCNGTVERTLGSSFGNVSRLSDGLDQIGFIHVDPLSLIRLREKICGEMELEGNIDFSPRSNL
jgi:hypothetical protein